jgi:hypothetical protein
VLLSSKFFLVLTPLEEPSKLISLGWIEIEEFIDFFVAANLLEFGLKDFGDLSCFELWSKR